MGMLEQVHPIELKGSWKMGWALDAHTTSSVYLGDDAQGHPHFDTSRSTVGEILFVLKYRNTPQVAPAIAAAMEELIRRWKPPVDLLVSVPPSETGRSYEPVFLIVADLARLLHVPFSNDAVTKATTNQPLKAIPDNAARGQELKQSLTVDKEQVADRDILLIDDIYRSGTTLNAVTRLLIEGGAKSVRVLTATKTRSNR